MRPLLDILGGLSIRLRLIALSTVLLISMIGSNLYLTGALRAFVDMGIESGRLDQRAETTNALRNAFEDLRYWQADLAVSLLTSSERNADAARKRLNAERQRLAAVRPAEAQRIGAEIDAYDELAKQAVDAYTQDQRVAGNTLFGQARVHGLAADDQLRAVDADLEREAAAARDRMLRRAASATTIALGVLIGVGVVGLGSTLLALRSILQPLKRLLIGMEAISRGELWTPLPKVTRDEIGRMTRTLALFRDSLDARARLERETERQRGAIADAVACISDGFVLYDRESRMVACNARYREQHRGIEDQIAPGVLRETLIRTLAERALIDAAPLSLADWIEQWLDGSTQDRLAYRVQGRRLQVSERAAHDGGRIEIVTDVSDLEQPEAEREEAEPATRAESEALAETSHELRPPLDAIVGCSERPQEDAAPTVEEAMREDRAESEAEEAHAALGSGDAPDRVGAAAEMARTAVADDERRPPAPEAAPDGVVAADILTAEEQEASPVDPQAAGQKGPAARAELARTAYAKLL